MEKLVIKPEHIHMWISNNDTPGYPGGENVRILNIPLDSVTVIDCDIKDAVVPSAVATVETDKGFHFICPPSVSHYHPLNDKNYILNSQKNKYWSQRIASKKDGSRRVMKCINAEWAPFVNKWNQLVINDFERKIDLGAKLRLLEDEISLIKEEIKNLKYAASNALMNKMMPAV